MIPLIFLSVTLLLGIAAFGRAIFSTENGEAPLALWLLSPIIIVAFSLILLLCGCGSSTLVTKVEVRERVDTLLIKGDTIRIADKSDSVRIEMATPTAPGFQRVIAYLDTMLNGVSIAANYSYPPDRWAIEIIERDTLIRWMVRDSIIREPYTVTEVPIWVYFVLALAAIIVLRSFFK